jgi:prepilin-type N-terminal cleavage/methylation domain-containing protein
MSPSSRHSARKAARSQRGFSLVELLVAVTLLMTFMGAIAMLFTTSLHAMKSGMQVIEADDEARGAFRIVERDLNSVFTSRNYGDYYSFFGTPFGMSMVGLVRAGESYNIGRISYVVLEADDDIEMIEAYEGGGDVQARVGKLVRFIEPGVEDLDSYPIDWVIAAGESIAVDGELSDAAGFPVGDSFTSLSAVTLDPLLARLRALSPRHEERLNAKKRELWLRMLARHGGVPDAWGKISKERLDYVVAENIVQGTGPYFRYGATLNGMGGVALSENWYGDPSTPQGTADPIIDDPTYSPLTPHLPSLVEMNLKLMFSRPYVGAKNYTRHMKYVIDIPVGYERPIPENMQ